MEDNYQKVQQISARTVIIISNRYAKSVSDIEKISSTLTMDEIIEAIRAKEASYDK